MLFSTFKKKKIEVAKELKVFGRGYNDKACLRRKVRKC